MSSDFVDFSGFDYTDYKIDDNIDWSHRDSDGKLRVSISIDIKPDIKDWLVAQGIRATIQVPDGGAIEGYVLRIYGRAQAMLFKLTWA